ncbi:MAG TPA: hypothetical protein VF006_30425 [Longimicrobium sp.]
MRKIGIPIVLGLVLCLAFDPYTFGGVGGDRRNFEVHAWQVVATASLVFVQLAALFSSSCRATLTLLVLELTLFCTLNLIYIIRDGFDARTVVGNYSHPLPLKLIVTGLLLRSVWILMAFRYVTRNAASRNLR